MKLSTRLIKKFEQIHGNNKLVLNVPNQDVWVIGDVHGCSREFRELCSQIRTENPEAIIVQLGDLIDRGYDLQGVFRVLEDYQVITTIGNHELNFIQELNGVKHCGSKARQETHKKFKKCSEVEQDIIKAHIGLMYNAVILNTNDKRYLLSHAPRRNDVMPVHLENAWTWCSRTTPVEETEFDGLISVYGHQHWNYVDIDDQIAKLDETQSLNVDSGCVYGHELVAVNLQNFDVIRVASSFNFDIVNGEN